MGAANALVLRIGRCGDEPARLERSQQSAEITRIEPEPRTPLRSACAACADLEQKSRFTERPVATEVMIVERSDRLRHPAIEAADLLDRRRVHSLTLVR